MSQPNAVGGPVPGGVGVVIPAAIPIGTIVPYMGARKMISNVLNQGWLFCDGNPLSTGAYPDLFAAIGYACGGSGDQFCVPNLQGWFLRGGRSHG